ncbi:MAG: hypothetical protein V3T60_10445 [Candidatus Binatia bacterium]
MAVYLEGQLQVDMMPFIGYRLGRNGVPWRVGSPCYLLTTPKWGLARGYWQHSWGLDR